MGDEHRFQVDLVAMGTGHDERITRHIHTARTLEGRIL
jgi:hypothetical protein